MPVYEAGVEVVATLSTLNFSGSDFSVSESPANQANVAIDYLNSGITRQNLSANITGAWIFNDTSLQLQDNVDTSKRLEFQLASISTGTARTLTAPDTSGTLITTGNLTDINSVGAITSGTWQGSIIAVQYGGTGRSSIPVNGVVFGNGTGALQSTAAGTGGQLLTASYMDYTMPRADDLPSFQISHQTTPCPGNPLGIKGCGEAGAIAAPPAVINAITDAIGVRELAMPATPQTVWRALQGAQVKQAAE